MGAKTRKFYFERDGGETWEYLASIKAALEDEGCFLMLGQQERLVVVTRNVPGFGRDMDIVAVPLTRIVPVWDDVVPAAAQALDAMLEVPCVQAR